VLLAVLFHGSTNLFTVSPAESVTGDLVLPVLATTTKWLLVLALIAVAGTRLARRPCPECLLQAAEAAPVDVRRRPSKHLEHAPPRRA
jgi:hypothetical protein